MNTWPDAGMTPFWGEKNTQWEGGWRVPAMVRWPGRIPAGAVTNEIVHHMDWLPTFLAAAGNETIKDDLLEGVTVDAMGGRDYRVHLDGYNLLPMLTGETDESPRKEIFYFTDDGDLAALRYTDWKVTFLEQKEWGTLRAWMEPLTPLRVPLIFNLRRDPYERAYRTSNTFYDWMLDRRLHSCTGAGLRGPVPGHVQGVSAAARGSVLQPRQGDGEAGRDWRHALTMSLHCPGQCAGAMRSLFRLPMRSPIKYLAASLAPIIAATVDSPDQYPGHQYVGEPCTKPGRGPVCRGLVDRTALVVLGGTVDRRRTGCGGLSLHRQA